MFIAIPNAVGKPFVISERMNEIPTLKYTDEKIQNKQFQRGVNAHSLSFDEVNYKPRIIAI